MMQMYNLSRTLTNYTNIVDINFTNSITSTDYITFDLILNNIGTFFGNKELFAKIRFKISANNGNVTIIGYYDNNDNINLSNNNNYTLDSSLIKAKLTIHQTTFDNILNIGLYIKTESFDIAYGIENISYVGNVSLTNGNQSISAMDLLTQVITWKATQDIKIIKNISTSNGAIYDNSKFVENVNHMEKTVEYSGVIKLLSGFTIGGRLTYTKPFDTNNPEIMVICAIELKNGTFTSGVLRFTSSDLKLHKLLDSTVDVANINNIYIPPTKYRYL